MPTPKLFEKYVLELENKNGEKLKNYNFRDKSSGWEGYSNNAIFSSGKSVTSKASENPYMRLFLSDIALRESCYNCNFKLGNKYSDITLGDFWGVKKCYPEMYNEKGVSCIIINTQKGMSIFDNVKDGVVYKECSLDNILKGNLSLKFSGKKSEKREHFFKDLDRSNDDLLDFDDLVKKYVPKESLINRLKRKGKSLAKKVIEGI